MQTVPLLRSVHVDRMSQIPPASWRTQLKEIGRTEEYRKRGTSSSGTCSAPICRREELYKAIINPTIFEIDRCVIMTAYWGK